MTAEEYAAWREDRERKVTAPTGNLALIETRWGTDDPAAALVGQAPTVTASTLVRRDLITGIEQHGVRLWDAESEAIKNFKGIDAYPYAQDWVLEGTWTEVPGARCLPFEHARDEGRTRDLPVPGDIHLTLAGRDYTVSAFDDEGTLLLVFGDPTNGAGTYHSGRFLFPTLTPGTDRVVLDFNKAFVPPCGFSSHYNCPMPPPQNRIAVPVLAGEKLPLFTNGFEV
ncbi:hypothetical protein Ade02nite_58560 [Paractinoplanes deccanensis]|uniref:DUF1684 domain-containing protein n=1 Tax=Paractinoplanes deccanensis TaxID=113561 RepID=A0ABQ3YBC2_9ACTN|nr:DUF1684 domain-containing protein [Actinoplanes deccanensis]GID77215.1 hypothetical protein Ade02nite_58560 [Actinoplanes deccanensis]